MKLTHYHNPKKPRRRRLVYFDQPESLIPEAMNPKEKVEPGMNPLEAALTGLNDKADIQSAVTNLRIAKNLESGVAKPLAEYTKELGEIEEAMLGSLQFQDVANDVPTVDGLKGREAMLTLLRKLNYLPPKKVSVEEAAISHLKEVRLKDGKLTDAMGQPIDPEAEGGIRRINEYVRSTIDQFQTRIDVLSADSDAEQFVIAHSQKSDAEKSSAIRAEKGLRQREIFAVNTRYKELRALVSSVVKEIPRANKSQLIALGLPRTLKPTPKSTAKKPEDIARKITYLRRQKSYLEGLRLDGLPTAVTNPIHEKIAALEVQIAEAEAKLV